MAYRIPAQRYGECEPMPVVVDDEPEIAYACRVDGEEQARFDVRRDVAILLVVAFSVVIFVFGFHP